MLDEANCKTYANVHPLGWKNSDQSQYDLVVIGAGAGGLVTAMRSTRLGAKVCIIERAFFGGDCLNNGCVPSKAFLKAGQVAKTIKSAA